MLAYKGFTEAQAKAHKKYMESKATIQLIMTGEQRDSIKDRAAALGLSVNAYVLGLVEADLAGGGGYPAHIMQTIGGRGNQIV